MPSAAAAIRLVSVNRIVNGAAVEIGVSGEALPVPRAAGVVCSTLTAGKVALPLTVQLALLPPLPMPPNPFDTTDGPTVRVPPPRTTVPAPSEFGTDTTLPALIVKLPVKVLFPLTVS